MSAVSTEFKQADGYFLVISTTGVTGWDFASGAMTVAQLPVIAAGQVLRDMGKTVLVGGIGAAATNATGATTSAGTAGVPSRVFRKVQLLNSVGAVTLAGNAPNGVSGNSTTYFTFYIELPTLGRSGSSANNALGGQFTYVSGLPGLYV